MAEKEEEQNNTVVAVSLLLGVLLGIFGNLLVSSLFTMLNSEFPQGIPSTILVFFFLESIFVILMSISALLPSTGLKKYYKVFLILVFLLPLLYIILSCWMIYSGITLLLNQNSIVQNPVNNSQIPTINVNILNNNQIPTFAALLISFLSIGIGAWTLHTQQKHNKLSVRPIGEMERYDLPAGAPGMSPQLTIILANSGMGPMIIQSIKTQNKLSGEIRGHPIDWVSPDEICSKTKGISRKLRDSTTIKEGEKVEILKFSWTTDDLKNLEVLKNIQMIRSILKDLVIYIKYTNIYGDEQPEMSESLETFGKIT